MTAFISLPMTIKTLLSTLLFLTSVGGICAVFLIGKKQGKASLALLIFSTALITAMLLLYASVIPAERAKPNIPAVSRWFSDIPLLIPIGIYAFCLAFLIIMIAREVKRQKMSIGPTSIKESLDRLGSGLCFSYPNGLVVLTNHKMNLLSDAIFQKPVQNARLFWDALESGEAAGGVMRLSGGDQPAFKLQDGTVYSFKREKTGGFYEITAADVTRQHALVNELQERNIELEKRNARIMEYGSSVDEYVSARERLETRVNIHGFLGQALLMTQSRLSGGETDLTNLLDIWQRNIEVLKMQSEPDKPADSFKSLTSAANAIGITVSICGKTPESTSVQKLLAAIGAEALTNAVRHAGAKRLEIHLSETDTDFIAVYTNDGLPPSSPIAEGGGLTSARRKVESAGGEMTVAHAPRFTLTVSIRKEVNEDV